MKEEGFLCMARRACRTADTVIRGEVYVEVSGDGLQRRELLFSNMWEAGIYARARKLLAVHVAGFVPPKTRWEDLPSKNSLWESMFCSSERSSRLINAEHVRYLANLEVAAREAGDVDSESFLERLERGPRETNEQLHEVYGLDEGEDTPG